MDFKKILVPIDGSKQAYEAVQQAVSLAELYEVSLTILFVIDLDKEISAFEQVSLGGYVEGYVPPELKDGAWKLLTELMHEMPREVQAESVVLVGDPGETIVEKAAAEGFDLIIMGSRGFGTFRRILMGSVSQYVLQHAGCPVMITR